MHIYKICFITYY